MGFHGPGLLWQASAGADFSLSPQHHGRAGRHPCSPAGPNLLRAAPQHHKGPLCMQRHVAGAIPCCIGQCTGGMCYIMAHRANTVMCTCRGLYIWEIMAKLITSYCCYRPFTQCRVALLRHGSDCHLNDDHKCCWCTWIGGSKGSQLGALSAAGWGGAGLCTGGGTHLGGHLPPQLGLSVSPARSALRGSGRQGRGAQLDFKRW